MSHTNKNAFNYETGQFICHVFASLTANEKSILGDVIEIIQKSQRTSPNWAWSPISDNKQDNIDSDLHITLLRGHRAIYYHQIKPLVDGIKYVCSNIQPICLCLDQFKIFHNFERTSQFLCISPRDTSYISEESRKLDLLKEKIRQVVDQFAIKLTNEDEDISTLAHCSLMRREVVGGEQFDAEDFLLALDKLCLSTFHEYPMCITRINQIQIKIGNHVYDVNLSK